MNAFSQDETEYKLKSVFIYNFTRFIDWPSTSFASPDAPFIIGVAGENPFRSILEQTVKGEFVGTHPILVKYFPDMRNVSGCHILYMNSRDITRIKDFILNNPDHTLTVSDMPEFNIIGGMVRFFKEKNKIRLEINTSTVRKANLVVSSKLLNLAKTD